MADVALVGYPSVGKSSFINKVSAAKSKVASYPDTIKQSPKLQLMQEIMKENGNIWNEELVKKHKEEMIMLLTREIEKYKKA